MFYNRLIVLLLVALFNCVWGRIALPEDMEPCHRSDPEFDKCVVEISKQIVPQLIPGDTKYHVPKLDPLFLPKMEIENGHLDLLFKDVNFYGLHEFQVVDFDLDEANKIAKITLLIPNFNIQSDYEIKGQILVLPIHGAGPANLTMVGGTYMYTLPYTVTEKNGKQFAKVMDDASSTFDIKRAYYGFEGLFNGNKELNDQTSQVLNANWKDVLQEVGPGVNDAVLEALKQILNGILEKVSLDDLFPK